MLIVMSDKNKMYFFMVICFVRLFVFYNYVTAIGNAIKLLLCLPRNFVGHSLVRLSRCAAPHVRGGFQTLIFKRKKMKNEISNMKRDTC